MIKSNVKAMMIVCFDIRGIIMIEWAPEGQTVNQKYYLEVLAKLQEQVRKKRPELWK
jgi:tRNA A37 threonylcarbamoyladenosine biosynthesis protein TsaE